MMQLNYIMINLKKQFNIVINMQNDYIEPENEAIKTLTLPRPSEPSAMNRDKQLLATARDGPQLAFARLGKKSRRSLLRLHHGFRASASLHPGRLLHSSRIITHAKSLLDVKHPEALYV